VAPSSLQPPADVLRGTSIDPERDDVDLGRVYKVRDFTCALLRDQRAVVANYHTVSTFTERIFY
jgi:hypothetical protein